MVKTCYRCKESKPLVEFYRNGQDSYCRPCRLEINREIRRKRLENPIAPHLPGEPSTQLAMELLRQNGIPSCMGRAVGMAWVDLAAWGCVPIEAKMCHKYRNQYMWGFTAEERRRGFHGLFMFIALTPERNRVFMVPADTYWIQTHGKPNKRAVSVTFGANRQSAYMEDLITPYEDRFDLVEKYRLEWMMSQLKTTDFNAGEYSIE